MVPRLVAACTEYFRSRVDEFVFVFVVAVPDAASFSHAQSAEVALVKLSVGDVVIVA